MYAMLPAVFFLSALLLVSAEDEHSEEKGDGYEGRKDLCENNDQEMYKELNACFEQEEKVVVDATKECAKEAAPASQGDVVQFMNAACQNVTIFKVFDKCFKVYEADEEFRNLMEITAEVLACNNEVLKKYGMETIETSSEETTES